MKHQVKSAGLFGVGRTSRVALRLSVSSWRTRDEDIDEAVQLLARLKAGPRTDK